MAIKKKDIVIKKSGIYKNSLEKLLYWLDALYLIL